jgi:hypothetical protein
LFFTVPKDMGILRKGVELKRLNIHCEEVFYVCENTRTLVV